MVKERNKAQSLKRKEKEIRSKVEEGKVCNRKTRSTVLTTEKVRRKCGMCGSGCDKCQGLETT